MDLKNKKVLVTPTSFGKNNQKIIENLESSVGEVIYNKTGKPLSAEALMELIPGVHGYIAGLDTISSDVIDSADSLQVISRYGVGYDNVDLSSASKKNIVVTNTPGANSVSVAELALASMLALARHMPTAIQSTKKGEWPRTNGLSLEGKTIAILGLGAIGKQLAKRLSAFDCQILAYDPFPDNHFASQYQVNMLSMEEILPQADFISIHIPLNPKTQKMVNASFLDQVKQGVLIINTSRGELIDEQALLKAIRSGKVSGAALDAFSQEPPDPNNELLQLPQVIVTPHMGAHTDGATNNMGWMATRDCLAVLNGEEPLFPIKQ